MDPTLGSLGVIPSSTTWNRYPTTTGAAGYHTIGGGLSSEWLTSSAARYSINDPILLTGPRLTNSGSMGLRTLTTTSNTNYLTDCNWTTCDPQYVSEDISDPDLEEVPNLFTNIWFDQETTSSTNLLYNSAACSTENKQFTNIDNLPLQIPVLAPNPATTEIKISGVEKGTYNIFDMAGKKVLSGTFSQGSSINIAKLPAATYTAEIIANDLSTKTKFIKQ